MSIKKTPSSTTQDANEILTLLYSNGIITPDVVSNIDIMNKKIKVLKVHSFAITPPTEKNPRWGTHLPDKKRTRVYKPTEQKLIEFLYHYYDESDAQGCRDTLLTIYPVWKDYKLALCRRTNTLYRIDLDWKKYYLNEELSQDLINKPIDTITRAEIRKWAHLLIKKYDMSRKQYMNVQTIIKQIFQYLIDNDALDKNPTDLLKIDSSMFRRVVKKSAETQIFYHDEVEQIVAHCRKLALETEDESYLAIPLFFQTGMRIGEILALGHDDFNRKNSTVFVHRSFCTQVEMKEDGTWSPRRYGIEEHLKKNAEPRTILVTDQVFELEKQIRIIQMKKGVLDNYLFHVTTPHVVTGKLYRICDELGISRRSPHKCRKTYISNLLNKGMDADFVREQAGHKDLQTTMNCYVYSTTRNEEKIRQLNEILAIG